MISHSLQDRINNFLYRKFLNVKRRILASKSGRKISRRVILISRFFSFYGLSTKIFTNQSVRNWFFSSKLGYLVLTDNLSLTIKFLNQIERRARRKQDSRVLYRIGVVYCAQRRYAKAAEVLIICLKADLAHKRSEAQITRTVLKLIQAERSLKLKPLMELYRNNQIQLPIDCVYLLECEYTLYSDDFEPPWKDMLCVLDSNFNIVLANFLILAALGHQKFEIIDSIKIKALAEDEVTEDLARKNALSRTLTMVAAAYYRHGETQKLLELNNAVTYDQLDWKIYQCFAKGETLVALNFRGAQILRTFLRFYPYNNNGKTRVICPEKDLCGEAFNALFYKAMINQGERFSIVSDSRLALILKRSFPTLTIISKTPRYRQATEPNNFSRLPWKLRDFLDNESFVKTKRSTFFPIDYKNLFQNHSVDEARKKGWLVADLQLQHHWLRKLACGKHLIGLSNNSTLRSRIRDIHMLNINNFDDLFALKNLRFINLDPGLDESSVANIAHQYDIDFVNPEMDLYDDFENLLALISILDVAIMPANNLMDFAAAMGTNTIVFSPSNIMKSWVIGDDKYIFSEKVKFIFPRNTPNAACQMVLDGVKHLSSTVFVNTAPPEISNV